ncbi:hypothetical protein ACU639_19440 [Streptomyces cynarae]|uniref:hypothetical protein n=1 Tax=Streptomyces cynarae TaxID=2981134 RepID=UPI00406C405C
MKMTASRRWRVVLASAASAAMLIGAPLVGAQAAFAQDYPPTTTSPVSVSATRVSAGSPLSFRTAAGVFPRRQTDTAPRTVTALLESTPVELGHFQAGEDGSVAGTVTIPQNTITGWHVFRLTADNPDPSVGVSIYVEGGVSEPPSPTPTETETPSPTPTKSPKPTRHPGGHDHGNKPGHGGHGHDNGHGGSHGRAAGADPADYQHHRNEQPNHSTKSLAQTGSDKAVILGGAATALFAVGGATVLAARRRRSS